MKVNLEDLIKGLGEGETLDIQVPNSNSILELFVNPDTVNLEVLHVISTPLVTITVQQRAIATV